MEARIDLTKSVPKDALHALYGLEQYIRRSGLEGVATINSWNRLAIAFRAVPGSYQRQTQAAR